MVSNFGFNWHFSDNFMCLFATCIYIFFHEVCKIFVHFVWVCFLIIKFCEFSIYSIHEVYWFVVFL